MDTVLDFDLDTFVWPIVHWPPWPGRAPWSSVEHLASEGDVRHFLERQCGLSSDKRLRGRVVETHDQAFDVWREWLRAGQLTQPFRVVHVDAHADLGLGDSGYVYLLTEFLALPLEARADPRRGAGAMGEGNYLAFALANRWIAELVYVFPTEPARIAAERAESRRAWNEMMNQPDVRLAEDHGPHDLLHVLFAKRDGDTGRIELKRYASRRDAADAAGQRGPGGPKPLASEPQVPFAAIPLSEFSASGFTHVVVAQSPRYTPLEADALLTTVSGYLNDAPGA